MEPGAHLRNIASVAAMAAMLVSCGGGGSGGGGGDSSGVIVLPPSPPPPTTPSPPPASPPAPPPVSITPVVGQIFANPLLTPTLFTVARGWQFDYKGDGSPITNPQISEEAGATYLAGSSSYRLTIPLLGTNTLYQSFTASDRPEVGGTAYIGTVAASPDMAVSKSDLLVLRPGAGTPYSYVSRISWYTVQELGGGLYRNSYGVLGLAQPTPTGSVPTTGTRHYTGTLLAHMEKNVGDFVIGTVTIDADFSSGTLSGSMAVHHICYMGCSYPSVGYALSNFVYARGGTEFSGVAAGVGVGSAGSFSGRFAGPGAEEFIISLRTPYYDPDRKVLVALSGVALARS